MSVDPLIGRKLGDYTIQALLGRGGMSRVYRGYDENLDRYAAVKVISGDFATTTEEEYTRRFQTEARAIAHLRHPNIVGIYQFGRSEGIYYMAQVFLEGKDLRTVLKGYSDRNQRMPVHEILRIVSDIASALDYAHEQGVIHRDVKPSNIMLEQKTGRAILMDFGLALSVHEGTTGDTFGSAHYIAPEQAISSAKAVPQSDLYSLGIVIYEMLAGKVPFDDPSVMSVALKHLNELPPPPTMYNPDLPRAVEAVILRVLDKDVSRRYRTGRELVDALTKAFEGAPLYERPAPTVRDILDSRPFPASPPVAPPSPIPPPSRPAPLPEPSDSDDSLAARFARRKARKEEEAILKTLGEDGLQIDDDTLNSILDSYQDPSEIGLVGDGAKGISYAEKPAALPTTAAEPIPAKRSRRGVVLPLLLILLLIAAGGVYMLSRENPLPTGGETGVSQTAASGLVVPAGTETTEAVFMATETAEAAVTEESTAAPSATATRTPTLRVTSRPTQPAVRITDEPIIPQVTDEATDRPTAWPTLQATPTSASTPTKTPTPEITDTLSPPANVRLTYNDHEIFVVNMSEEAIDISLLVFEQQRDDGTTLSYSANLWDLQDIAEPTYAMGGSGGCYQLVTGQGARLARSNPPVCPRFIGTFQTSITSRYFWISDDADATFTVRRTTDPAPLAVCAIAAGECEFYLPPN